MKTPQTLILLVAGALLGLNVYACDMHGGFGGGAYGMDWRPYDPNADYSSYSSSETDNSDTVSDTQTRARPVFSSSVLRSSDAAKAKLAKEKADTDSEDESTDDE